MRRSFWGILTILLVALLSVVAYRTVSAAREMRALARTSGQSGPFTDFRMEKPGSVHHISAADLPQPYATPAADTWCPGRRKLGHKLRTGSKWSFTLVI